MRKGWNIILMLMYSASPAMGGGARGQRILLPADNCWDCFKWMPFYLSLFHPIASCLKPFNLTAWKVGSTAHRCITLTRLSGWVPGLFLLTFISYLWGKGWVLGMWAGKRIQRVSCPSMIPFTEIPSVQLQLGLCVGPPGRTLWPDRPLHAKGLGTCGTAGWGTLRATAGEQKEPKEVTFTAMSRSGCGMDELLVMVTWVRKLCYWVQNY